MATTFIDMDNQTFLGRKHERSMSLLRDGLYAIQESVDIFTRMVDGDGSNVTHFSLLVSEGIYPTTAHAKASFDELQSLKFVVMTAEAAILQACAKHGV